MSTRKGRDMAKISARGAYKVAEIEAHLDIPERHYEANEHGPAFTAPARTSRYVFLVRSDGAILVSHRISGGYRDGRRGGYSVYTPASAKVQAVFARDREEGVRKLANHLRKRGYKVDSTNPWPDRRS